MQERPDAASGKASSKCLGTERHVATNYPAPPGRRHSIAQSAVLSPAAMQLMRPATLSGRLSR
jgi:hypothetical protein